MASLPKTNPYGIKGEKGKNTLLYGERQGIGDDIIFLSLVPEVKEMCSTFIGIC